MIHQILTITFLAQVVRLAIPYALAAMGGAITERAGVIDLALEAKLLFGAFAAAAVGISTGSPVLAVLGGLCAGMLVAAIQIYLALKLEANQVVVGIGLNLVALGGTRFLLQLFYGEGANSPKVPGFEGSIVANPIAWLTVIAAIGLPFAIQRTRWGLRLRAAGDRPEALVSVGVSPIRARLAAGLVGGALAGAGGAQLTLNVDGFHASMSSGRGYIALAMVILAGWRPGFAAIACAGVAFADALGAQLQISAVGIPPELAQLAPYVLTLAVLIVFGGKYGRPPRSLGRL